MPRVIIRALQLDDQAEFLKAVRASRNLHQPWITVPQDAPAFKRYLERFQPPHAYCFVICLQKTGAIVGSVNLTQIAYGAYCSAVLGYFAFAGYEGQGLISQGLRKAIAFAFKTLRLHRLEANIQPHNKASIALVKACGFHKEGLARGFIKLRGRWRDHERWALLKN
ncbi:GNAT family N-acetyltransferase [Limnobacter sp.]|uniref:GNAT family N-acetyltransferase n=1 Tax=Limnobacter sp. TaxID=2003368 RepID=UPI003519AEEB